MRGSKSKTFLLELLDIVELTEPHLLGIVEQLYIFMKYIASRVLKKLNCN